MLCFSLFLQFVMLICEYIAVGKGVSDGTILDRKKRTIIGQYPLCPLGCTSCSEMNGCVSCSPNFYMLLVRNGMRQTGVCTHNCPTGFYGVRRSNFSQCYRCSIDHCEACFSRTYCTRCTPPHVAYRGECIDGCPNGLHYANYSKDCREKVDCMVGPWSNWGSCRRNGQTCGYKYGIVSRARSVLEYPSPNGDQCPTLTENVCCRMRMRHCAGETQSHTDEPPGSRRLRNLPVDCSSLRDAETNNVESGDGEDNGDQNTEDTRVTDTQNNQNDPT